MDGEDFKTGEATVSVKGFLSNGEEAEVAKIYVKQIAPHILVSKREFKANPDGDTINLTLWSDYDWTVESDSDWCVVNGNSKAGVFTNDAGKVITLTVKDGWFEGDYGNRLAVITAKNINTGETVRVYISQPSNPKEAFFNVSDTTFTVAPEGGTMNFTLVCNKDWTVKSNQDWCVIDEEDRSGGNTNLRGRKITFTVEDVWSAGYYGTRNAVITAKNTDTGETAEIKISQIMSLFDISTTSFDIAPEGGTLSFDLLCNQDWTLENDSDWCVFASSDMSSGDTGPDGRHITFTVKDGWSGGYHGDRQAVITARNLNSGETVRIYVNQEASLYSADYFFNVSAHSLTASPLGGKYNFILTCNADWIAKSDSDWCVINASDRSGNPTATSGRTITFTVKGEEDEGYHEERRAVITVTNKASGKTLKVDVLQEASELDEEEEWDHFFTVSPKSLTVSPLGEKTSFVLMCWPLWVVESDSDWCVINSADVLGYNTGAGGKRITFTVAPNLGNSPRKAIITVTKKFLPDDTGGETRKVEVEQAMIAGRVATDANLSFS